MDETKIKLILRKFSKKRNWDQFHTLRNLATALSVEASELLEIFQWFNEDKTKKIDKNLKNKISEEVADIMLYLIRFSDIAKINIEEECLKKIKKNKKKYPIKLSKGISKKYNELQYLYKLFSFYGRELMKENLKKIKREIARAKALKENLIKRKKRD